MSCTPFIVAIIADSLATASNGVKPSAQILVAAYQFSVSC